MRSVAQVGEMQLGGRMRWIDGDEVGNSGEVSSMGG